MEISFEFLLDCLNIEYFPSQAWRKYREENSNEFTGKNGYDSEALAKRFLTMVLRNIQLGTFTRI